MEIKYQQSLMTEILKYMDSLEMLVMNSSFEHIEKFNERIYHEIEREGYHSLTTETKKGIKQSLTIFKNLKNRDFLQTLISGYEYLNDTSIYFGKVIKLDKYIAKEYSDSHTRIKVLADNNQLYSIPEIAEEHLKIKIFKGI